MTPGIPRCATARLVVRARLLTVPCLWCWEIVDERHDTVVRSSWAHEWAAYESRSEALAAGYACLMSLTTGERPLTSTEPASQVA